MLRQLLRACAEKCPIIASSFMLTGDGKGPKPFTERDGILAVPILYVMHGWKSVSSKSLEESLLVSLPDVFQLGQVRLMLLHTACYKNCGCITSSVSTVSTTRRTCKASILQRILQQSTKNFTFTPKVVGLFMDESWITRAGITDTHKEHVWLEENPLAIWYHH